MKKLLTIVLLTFLFRSEVCGQADTLTKIIPDDYPVSNNMLEGNYEHRVSGEITSLDKAWFTNDTLKQTLVFELYTDYHRFYIYHFYNDNIPNELINGMELNVATGQFKNIFDTASTKQKQKYFRGFLSTSKKISQSYFRTNKGLKLGDKKEKVLRIYGKPDTSVTTNGIEQCEWKFEGDYIDDETPLKKRSNKPFARNSFGYTVTMFFKSEKLLAMILNNDIP